MKIVIMLIGAFAFLAIGTTAMAGYVQGEFETVPEGVTWLRAVLGDSIQL